MHRVLRNSYATCPHQNEQHDVAIRCARLKEMMGLEPDFPWGADEYFAAEKLAWASTGLHLMSLHLDGCSEYSMVE